MGMGGLIPWDNLQVELPDPVPATCQRAYEKLIGNIDLTKAQVVPDPGEGTIFITNTVWAEANKAWEIKVGKRQHKRYYMTRSNGEKKIRTYANREGILVPIVAEPLP